LGIFLDSLVAALAAMGILLLAKVVISFWELPLRRQADVQLCVLLQVQGHGDTMAAALKKLVRLRRFGDFDIIMEDLGLDPKARRSAENLAHETHITLTEHREVQKKYGRDQL